MLLQPRTQPGARGEPSCLRFPSRSSPAASCSGSLSLLLPSAPTYDPFAWIIWGREILHLDLNTVDGPSWKPLPVIVTTLTAPLGEASPYIWVAVAARRRDRRRRARLAARRRLAGPRRRRASPPWGSASCRGGCATARWATPRGSWSRSSLGAVLCHLHGRRGWAFTLAIGAGLLRPEAWPFLGLYALWLLSRSAARLPWIAGGLASLPVLWLGPELWGSGNAFRASDRAQTPNPDSPAFADNPALEVLKNALDMAPALAVAFAVVAVGARRRALALAAARASRTAAARLASSGSRSLAAAWIGARRGDDRPRLQRQPALPHRARPRCSSSSARSGSCWAARALLGAAAPRCRRLWPPRPRRRARGRLRRPRRRAARADAGAASSTRPTSTTTSASLIDEAGGAERLRGCGHAYTGPFLVPQVAWRLDVHAKEVDLEPRARPRSSSTSARSSAPRRPAARRRPARTSLAREGHWALTADCEAPR